MSEAVIDISRRGISWLDITEPPPEGESWPSYLRRSMLNREVEFARSSQTYSEFKSRFVAFRFSHEMARVMVRDLAMLEAFKVMTPDDWGGWFPKRLYGCPCFRESAPGSIFKTDLKGK